MGRSVLQGRRERMMLLRCGFRFLSQVGNIVRKGTIGRAGEPREAVVAGVTIAGGR